jgi:hypothetical protein
MADTPNNAQVPMNNGAVKQKHRMAAGLPVDGKSLPPAPPAGPRTPA